MWRSSWRRVSSLFLKVSSFFLSMIAARREAEVALHSTPLFVKSNRYPMRGRDRASTGGIVSVARPLLRRLQSALRPSPRLGRLRLSLPARRFDLARCLALSTRSRTRSHRHLGRLCHCPASLARPSRLCRRNRRTLASTGGHAARLSRGCSTARSAAATRRTRPTRPGTRGVCDATPL